MATPQYTLKINNEVIPYSPGTLEYTLGLGEAQGQFQTTGGLGGEIIYSQDLTTLKSSVKFEMLNTSVNNRRVINWRQVQDRNVLILADPNNASDTFTFTRSFTTTESTFTDGAEASITVEFEGEKAA